MKWNWQLDGWPEFEFDAAQLAALETAFVRQSGLVLGASEHLDVDDLQGLRVELFCEEALKTSAIEGEFLNRDSVQASIQHQLGLQTDLSAVPLAEQGVAELTVDLYRTWSEPLSSEMLFSWHKMIMRGRRDLSDVGRYRIGAEPMRVMSGLVGDENIHFEAPPSAKVPDEMNAFLNWFNTPRAKAGGIPQALTRSGIAHLWFVSVHPFGDGNGRIGRAVAEKVLAQTQGHPLLIAIAHNIEANRKAYYGALEAVNRTLDITPWLTWFGQTVLDAQGYTIGRVRFLIAKAKFYDRLGSKLNERQSKVIARMFREGLGGFKGGLSADNYIRIAKTSASTATRDLQELVAMGALVRKGQRRYTRYQLNVGTNR